MTTANIRKRIERLEQKKTVSAKPIDLDRDGIPDSKEPGLGAIERKAGKKPAKGKR